MYIKKKLVALYGGGISFCVYLYVLLLLLLLLVFLRYRCHQMYSERRRLHFDQQLIENDVVVVWVTKMSKHGLVYSLLPSHATIFTLSTRANSCTSRNSTSFSINVQTLSQNRYVFNLAALNVTRALTFVFSAVFIDLSNCNRTLSASWGVIWPNCVFCSHFVGCWCVFHPSDCIFNGFVGWFQVNTHRNGNEQRKYLSLQMLCGDLSTKPNCIALHGQ